MQQLQQQLQQRGSEVAQLQSELQQVRLLPSQPKAGLRCSVTCAAVLDLAGSEREGGGMPSVSLWCLGCRSKHLLLRLILGSCPPVPVMLRSLTHTDSALSV